MKQRSNKKIKQYNMANLNMNKSMQKQRNHPFQISSILFQFQSNILSGQKKQALDNNHNHNNCNNHNNHINQPNNCNQINKNNKNDQHNNHQNQDDIKSQSIYHIKQHNIFKTIQKSLKSRQNTINRLYNNTNANLYRFKQNNNKYQVQSSIWQNFKIKSLNNNQKHNKKIIKEQTRQHNNKQLNTKNYDKYEQKQKQTKNPNNLIKESRYDRQIYQNDNFINYQKNQSQICQFTNKSINDQQNYIDKLNYLDQFNYFDQQSDQSNGQQNYQLNEQQKNKQNGQSNHQYKNQQNYQQNDQQNDNTISNTINNSTISNNITNENIEPYFLNCNLDKIDNFNPTIQININNYINEQLNKNRNYIKCYQNKQQNEQQYIEQNNTYNKDKNCCIRMNSINFNIFPAYLNHDNVQQQKQSSNIQNAKLHLQSINKASIKNLLKQNDVKMFAVKHQQLQLMKGMGNNINVSNNCNNSISNLNNSTNNYSNLNINNDFGIIRKSSLPTQSNYVNNKLQYLKNRSNSLKPQKSRQKNKKKILNHNNNMCKSIMVSKIINLRKTFNEKYNTNHNKLNIKTKKKGLLLSQQQQISSSVSKNQNKSLLNNPKSHINENQNEIKPLINDNKERQRPKNHNNITDGIMNINKEQNTLKIIPLMVMSQEQKYKRINFYQFLKYQKKRLETFNNKSIPKSQRKLEQKLININTNNNNFDNINRSSNINNNRDNMENNNKIEDNNTSINTNHNIINNANNNTINPCNQQQIDQSIPRNPQNLQINYNSFPNKSQILNGLRNNLNLSNSSLYRLQNCKGLQKDLDEMYQNYIKNNNKKIQIQLRGKSIIQKYEHQLQKDEEDRQFLNISKIAVNRQNNINYISNITSDNNYMSLQKNNNKNISDNNINISNINNINKSFSTYTHYPQAKQQKQFKILSHMRFQKQSDNFNYFLLQGKQPISRLKKYNFDFLKGKKYSKQQIYDLKNKYLSKLQKNKIDDNKKKRFSKQQCNKYGISIVSVNQNRPNNLNDNHISSKLKRTFNNKISNNHSNNNNLYLHNNNNKHNNVFIQNKQQVQFICAQRINPLLNHHSFTYYNQPITLNNKSNNNKVCRTEQDQKKKNKNKRASFKEIQPWEARFNYQYQSPQIDNFQFQ